MFRKLLKTHDKQNLPSSSDTSPYQIVCDTIAPPLAETRPKPYPLNKVASAYLTQSDIRTFSDDGVVCIRNVLSPDEIEALRVDINTQMTQDPPSETAIDLEKIQKQIWGGVTHSTAPLNLPSSELTKILNMILKADPNAAPNLETLTGTLPGKFYVDIRQWPHMLNIQNIALHSVLPAICANLMKSQTLSFWGDTTRVKWPNTAQKTIIRQDWAYLPISGTQSCSVWIALDATSHDNGGKYFIRGSHQTGKTYATNVFISRTRNPLSLYDTLPDIGNDLTHSQRITFNVEPGDVIIYHVMTLHGAHGNTTLDKMRRAMTLRYCGDDIRYFDKPGAFNTDYIHPRLLNGDPFSPHQFPPVWPKP